MNHDSHGHHPHLTVIRGEGVPSPETIVGDRTMNGKQGLIIGMGLGGIAEGCLTVLSAFGAQIAVAAINENVLNKCEAFIKANGFNVPAFLTCDVGETGAVDRLFSSLRSATGWDRLDFVIFSVASADKHEIKKPLKESTRAGLIEAFSISALPLVEIARNCEELMTEGGCVISLGYEGSERVTEGYHVMAAAKAALTALSHNLADELGPKGIRFNVVSPGPIQTRAASGLPGFNRLLASSQATAMLPGKVTIYDAGHTVAFLVSNAARNVTAEVIHVDLGTHAVGIRQDHSGESCANGPADAVAKSA